MMFFKKQHVLIEWLLEENRRLMDEIMRLYKERQDDTDKRINLAYMLNEWLVLSDEQIKERIRKYLFD